VSCSSALAAEVGPPLPVPPAGGSPPSWRRNDFIDAQASIIVPSTEK
jgi:hypothetical protein